jgi:hypothetical protein
VFREGGDGLNAEEGSISSRNGWGIVSGYVARVHETKGAKGERVEAERDDERDTDKPSRWAPFL